MQDTGMVISSIQRVLKISGIGSARFFAGTLGVEVFGSKNNETVLALRSSSSSENKPFNGSLITVDKIIAMPPNRLNRVAHSAIFDFIKHIRVANYEWICATNGTMVTLYFWDGNWCLASSRCTDISNHSLNGTRKVFDIFMDLADAQRIPVEDLDQNVAYTFVISHHEFHILVPYNFLYFISAYDRTTGKFVDVPELDAFRQYNVDVTQETLQEIVNYHCFGCVRRFEQGIDLRSVNGLILRPKKAGGKHFYLPSDITEFLKRSIYSSYNLHDVMPKFTRTAHVIRIYVHGFINKDVMDYICRTKYPSDYAAIDAYMTKLQTEYLRYKATGVFELTTTAVRDLFKEAEKNKLESIIDPSLAPFHIKLIVQLNQ